MPAVKLTMPPWVIQGEGTAVEIVDGVRCIVARGHLNAAEVSSQGYGRELLAAWHSIPSRADNTYVLVGPRIRKNPYNLEKHQLLPSERPIQSVPRGLERLNVWFEEHPEVYGVAWTRKDNTRFTLLRQDLGLPWPGRPRVKS